MRNRKTSVAVVAALSLAVASAGVVVMHSRDDRSRAAAQNTPPVSVLVNSQFDLVLPPRSLGQLVSESDAIVIGVFTGEVDGTDVVLPSKASSHLPAGITAGVTFSNLNFRVSEYVKGEGAEELLIRQTGDLLHSPGPAAFPKPFAGERTLLFLVRSPRGANVWESHLGPWGRMSEVGGSMHYRDGDSTAVDFFVGKGFSDAVQVVRDAVPAAP